MVKHEIKKRSSKFVNVDRELSGKLVIMQRKDGGFQRQLTDGRLRSISENLGNGLISPAIMVADVDGQLIVIDGQHRLEAWRRKSFPLTAHIVKMSYNDAISNFINHNTKSKRVSRLHILNVDPRTFAKKVRLLAAKYNATLTQVYHICYGLNSGHAAEQNADGINWDKVETILSIWSDDKRWKTRRTTYVKPGIMQMLGSLCKTSGNPGKLVSRLKNMKFGAQSFMNRHYGASRSDVRFMSEYALKWLHKNFS